MKTDELEKLLEDAADFSSALDWDTLAEAAKEDYVWAVNRLIHERKQAAKLLAIVRRQREAIDSFTESCIDGCQCDMERAARDCQAIARGEKKE